eukprot:g9684.t1
MQLPDDPDDLGFVVQMPTEMWLVNPVNLSSVQVFYVPDRPSDLEVHLNLDTLMFGCALKDVETLRRRAIHDRTSFIALQNHPTIWRERGKVVLQIKAVWDVFMQPFRDSPGYHVLDSWLHVTSSNLHGAAAFAEYENSFTVLPGNDNSKENLVPLQMWIVLAQNRVQAARSGRNTAIDAFDVSRVYVSMLLEPILSCPSDGSIPKLLGVPLRPPTAVKVYGIIGSDRVVQRWELKTTKYIAMYFEFLTQKGIRRFTHEVKELLKDCCASGGGQLRGGWSRDRPVWMPNLQDHARARGRPEICLADKLRGLAKVTRGDAPHQTNMRQILTHAFFYEKHKALQ